MTSCVFNSDEEYFKDVPKPDPAAVDASMDVLYDLNEYNQGDTIDIFGSADFRFALTGKVGSVESADIFLNGKWLESVENSFFSIGLFDLKDGIFPLEVRAVAKSGTGSLADAVGSEKINVTLKWVLRIDLTPPSKPVPTVDIIDGFLTLKWDPYTRPSFKSYSVSRQFPGGRIQTFEIKDRNTTTWRDEVYVGAHASPTKYSVSIVSEIATVTSDVISRTDPLVSTFTFDPSDSTFTYTWEPTKFYGTFKEYQFNGSIASTVKLTDVNATTYKAKLNSIRFGGDSYVSIKVQAKSADFPDYWTYNTCRIGTPLPFVPNGQIRFNTHLNTLVTLDSKNNLLELNENFEAVRTIATLKGPKWRMPYPGNYVYATGSSSLDDNIYRLNLDDNTETAYDFFYLWNQNSSNTVTSTGLICVDYDTPPVGPPTNIPARYRIAAFDAADDTHPVLNEISTTTKLSAIISEDGRYIWANGNRVFKISGGTSALVGSFTPVGTFIGFRPDNSDEIMFRNDTNINFYDANTFTLIRTINVPAGVYWNDQSYDVQTKSMLWKSNGSSWEAYVVNIETGATKLIQISPNISPGDLYLLGGLLINKGTYIELK